MSPDEIEAAATSLAQVAHMTRVVDPERRDQYVAAMMTESPPRGMPVPYVVNAQAVCRWLAAGPDEAS